MQPLSTSADNPKVTCADFSLANYLPQADFILILGDKGQVLE